MNFLALGKVLLDLGLPVLGTVLGVPELAPAAIDMVTDALGLPKSATTEQIAAAAKADPEVLKAVEATAAEKWKALAVIAESNARQSEAINANIGAETAAKVPWHHWRHLHGYVTALWIFAPLPFVCIGMGILVYTGKADVLNALITAITACLAWVAVSAGLSGYIAQDTTKKVTATRAGEPVTGVIAGVIKALTKR